MGRPFKPKTPADLFVVKVEYRDGLVVAVRKHTSYRQLRANPASTFKVVTFWPIPNDDAEVLVKRLNRQLTDRFQAPRVYKIKAGDFTSTVKQFRVIRAADPQAIA